MIQKNIEMSITEKIKYSNSDIINSVLDYDSHKLNTNITELITQNIEELTSRLKKELSIQLKDSIDTDLHHFYKKRKCDDYQHHLYDREDIENDCPNYTCLYSIPKIEYNGSSTQILYKSREKEITLKLDEIKQYKYFMLNDKPFNGYYDVVHYMNQHKEYYIIFNKKYILGYTYFPKFKITELLFIKENDLTVSALFILKQVLSKFISIYDRKTNRMEGANLDGRVSINLIDTFNQFYDFYKINKPYFMDTHVYIENTLQKEKEHYEKELETLKEEKLVYECLKEEMIEQKEHYETLDNMYERYQEDTQSIMEEKVKLYKSKKDFEKETELFQIEKNKFIKMIKELNMEDYIKL